MYFEGKIGNDMAVFSLWVRSCLMTLCIVNGGDISFLKSSDWHLTADEFKANTQRIWGEVSNFNHSCLQFRLNYFDAWNRNLEKTKFSFMPYSLVLWFHSVLCGRQTNFTRRFRWHFDIQFLSKIPCKSTIRTCAQVTVKAITEYPSTKKRYLRKTLTLILSILHTMS